MYCYASIAIAYGRLTKPRKKGHRVHDAFDVNIESSPLLGAVLTNRSERYSGMTIKIKRSSYSIIMQITVSIIFKKMYS